MRAGEGAWHQEINDADVKLRYTKALFTGSGIQSRFTRLGQLRFLSLSFSLFLANLFVAVLWLFSASIAHANDAICVVCSDPDQTYRCNVLRDDGLTEVSGFQFYCIKEIAREMGHRSCSVRSNAGHECEGIEKTLVFDGRALERPVDPALAGEGVPQADVQGAQSDETRHEIENNEPQTLIELTDQTVKSSQKQLKKTGEAIGTATKKTGQAIGDVTKKTGDTVVGAVKKTGEGVGTVVKKSGEVIGSAAKSTFNCVTSLFTNCF